MSAKRKNRARHHTIRKNIKYNAVPGLAIVSNSKHPHVPHGSLGAVSASKIPEDILRQLTSTKKLMNKRMMKKIGHSAKNITRKQSGGDGKVKVGEVRVIPRVFGYPLDILGFELDYLKAVGGPGLGASGIGVPGLGAGAGSGAGAAGSGAAAGSGSGAAAGSGSGAAGSLIIPSTINSLEDALKYIDLMEKTMNIRIHRLETQLGGAKKKKQTGGATKAELIASMKNVIENIHKLRVKIESGRGYTEPDWVLDFKDVIRGLYADVFKEYSKVATEYAIFDTEKQTRDKEARAEGSQKEQELAAKEAEWQKRIRTPTGKADEQMIVLFQRLFDKAITIQNMQTVVAAQALSDQLQNLPASIPNAISQLKSMKGDELCNIFSVFFQKDTLIAGAGVPEIKTFIVKLFGLDDAIVATAISNTLKENPFNTMSLYSELAKGLNGVYKAYSPAVLLGASLGLRKITNQQNESIMKPYKDVCLSLMGAFSGFKCGFSPDSSAAPAAGGVAAPAPVKQSMLSRVFGKNN